MNYALIASLSFVIGFAVCYILLCRKALPKVVFKPKNIGLRITSDVQFISPSKRMEAKKFMNEVCKE